MKNITRRNFVKNTSSLLLFPLAKNNFYFKNNKPLLSFSTLGCPDWSFDTIVHFAATNGYNGIEIRGIEREMYLPKCPVFSADKINDTMQLVKDKRLHIVNLGSSAALHHSDAAERKKNLDEAKAFIDLAQQLHCSYIRVFPNDFPPGQDRNATMELIAKGLQELGDYAKNTNVTVLMETHGEVVKADDIVHIMQLAAHPKVGLVWDIVNMWSVTKEPPAQVYQKLKPYIHHAHIKDLSIVNGKELYTLLGQGISPVFAGIDVLYRNAYTGYYSFEWEKLWHPEIAEPEIALADYPVKMRAHFKDLPE
ncbi:sugar phosphate isomerase/epimerase [Ilyomonas limi]|uniref:Sugar phosphate isomerase/epimerase n=1 Tax=Ilyomonas limi TaxID=2575867 RepID=A0A4V5UTL9_9BACT|nr:sugar phosphate isomerase/epimerase family protein [Ilyomonas limi]TKK65543.1 sugar phosphate isomerase/epimerase [Ilyomonas limi]